MMLSSLMSVPVSKFEIHSTPHAVVPSIIAATTHDISAPGNFGCIQFGRAGRVYVEQRGHENWFGGNVMACIENNAILQET
jgi:hypothetical protein